MTEKSTSRSIPVARTATPGSLVTFAREELLGAISAAQRQVRFASPFLSRGVAIEVARAAKASTSREQRLLTAVTPRSVTVGVLSARGLIHLLRAGIAIKSIPNLHAKVALVDGQWGLLGSGNLTSAGLGRGQGGRGNLELGVRLTRQQVVLASGLFDGWWAHPFAETVTEENLAHFVDLEPSGRRESSKGALGKPIGLPPKPSSEARAGPSTLWAKAMYESGKADGEWWLRRSWIHDRHQVRGGAISRRPGYRVGDRIALYVVGPSRVPAVLRVAGEPYDGREEVQAAFGVQEAEKYGWVTPVEVVRSSPLEAAPGLDLLGVSPGSLQNGFVRVRNSGGFAELEARLGSVLGDY